MDAVSSWARALAEAGACLAGNVGLMSKVYFPRIMLPAASMVGHLVDFAVSMILVVFLLVWYGHMPGLSLVFAPLFIVLALALAFGLSLWLSALDAQIRDIRYILPFVLQIWMFATPIVFPASAVPSSYRWLLDANPLTHVVNGFRWSLLGLGDPPGLIPLLVACLLAVILIVTGASFFRVVERTMIDTI